MRVSASSHFGLRPGAGVEKLDEHTGGWQSGMHRGSDSLELSQAGVPGAELVIPQVDDSYSSRIGDELVVTCTVVWLEQREKVEDRAPKGTKRGTQASRETSYGVA